MNVFDKLVNEFLVDYLGHYNEKDRLICLYDVPKELDSEINERISKITNKFSLVRNGCNLNILNIDL